MLSPVEDNSEDITWINGYLGKAHKLRQSLVEFPGILLPSFQPTLQALQKMSRTLDLPSLSSSLPRNNMQEISTYLPLRTLAGLASPSVWRS